MIASVNNGRVNGGYFPFGDERVLAREFARELIAQLSSLTNPLTAIFHNIFSTTIGDSRVSAASMLFPLLAMGMMSSDIVAPVHSNTKQGSTMLDQVKNQEASLAKFDADAEETLKHRGYEVKKAVDKKKAPANAKSLVQEQEKLAKQKESLIKRAEKTKQKYAGEVDKLSSAFTELPKATEERLRDLRSEYKIANSHNNSKLAAQVNQRLKYTEAILRSKPIADINEIDSAVDEIMQLETRVNILQQSASSRWTGRYARIDLAKADSGIEEINQILKPYDISRDKVSRN